MTKFLMIAAALLTYASGCAHGKMGQIGQPLDRSLITKTTPIFVEPITAEGAVFTGDKAGVAARITEEKSVIYAQYNRRIAEALRKKGYNAKSVAAPGASGVVITGHVTTLEHGSAAARILVGMGSGSSNLYTDFKIEDRAKHQDLSKFEIIATSGGNGGLASAGSFMDKHLDDGADKLADYVAGEK